MLAPWKESYNKPTWHIKKPRKNFAHKDLYSQSYGFSSSLVWMGELDNKKKLSTKELMTSNCGAGEDLRLPSTARRSNQSILKEISPEYSLEGLVLKLKLQYFDHLMQRAHSLEKTLRKIEGRGRRG